MPRPLKERLGPFGAWRYDYGDDTFPKADEMAIGSGACRFVSLSYAKELEERLERAEHRLAEACSSNAKLKWRLFELEGGDDYTRKFMEMKNNNVKTSQGSQAAQRQSP